MTLSFCNLKYKREKAGNLTIDTAQLKSQLVFGVKANPITAEKTLTLVVYPS